MADRKESEEENLKTESDKKADVRFFDIIFFPNKSVLFYILFYIPLAIVMALIFIRLSERVGAFKILLWEILAVFGYFASAADLRERRIPNRLIQIMAGAWVLVMIPQLFFRLEDTLYELLDGGLGFLACGLLMTMIYLISRKGLGGGDVKFMTVSGLYLGISSVFTALLYGSIFAALTGLILIALKKVGPKDAIPLVPFLYIGITLAVIIR